MKEYLQMTETELQAELKAVDEEYNRFAAMKLSLNMARGKPSAEQLDFSEELLTVVDSREKVISANGVDCRNYGGLDVLSEAGTGCSGRKRNIPLPGLQSLW